ncbi:MAG: dimethylarginine dimethylaminohydrolase family protein [Myxococcota bacterium]|jgi:dimethylargininase
MTRTLALTRAVPESLARCELTHLARTPIDLARARAQHAAYEHALAAAGCELVRLPELPEFADSVFVEDCAVVLDELAIATRPGALSRRGEVESVAAALGAQREVRSLTGDATLDGGDVLALERTLFVGLSRRTNAEGARQLHALTAPFGYAIVPLAVESALHLKTAVTRAGERTLVVNPQWVETRSFASWERIEVDAREPFAANVLRVRDTTICAAAFSRTNDRLRARGIAVNAVDVSELAKAEAGVTCCALIASLG